LIEATTSDQPPVALLLTDLVDSSALAAELGDEVMNGIWAAHDRIARDLLRPWRGHEIDKTDGFLLLFAEASDALGYALAYHQALAQMAVPLKARAGLHVGQVAIRETPAEDVALGAKPFEVDGVSKPIAARVMSTALGGQTLVTRAALDALGKLPQRVMSHGHWRVKGIPVPLELFEVGDEGAPFTPPPDSAKVFRVVKQDDDIWLPVRELRHSLPAERDAFVGRRPALQELARRFDAGARLVSVLGIGGAGKTRLATRFGWAWLGEFPGGVWFCDLAPARGIEGLVSAVAQGLQLPLGSDDPVPHIGQAIAGRGHCLVILDNFEHLARHAEATLGRWLERAGQACFLVTTREVLGIAGEETLALAPMVAADAERLFERRAAAAKRDFAPGAEDREAIATLVRLLDGLPLAIELAAARVRTLAPRALLARMSERFKLLASSGGRQDRQATLRAAFDWSWDLLPSAEKMALAQLSVFEGGFTLEAAEAVLDLSSLADPPWTLDVVNALVDKSFVRPLGNERFDLLVSVQAYAAEHLQTEGRYAGSGPAALVAAQNRHAAWFASLGPERATENRCADLDNLVAACRRAIAAGHCEHAVGALESAWAALYVHGPFKAGVELATQVAAMAALAGAAAGRAFAVLGWSLETSGQRGPAAQHLQTALAQAVAAGDRRCEAFVSIRLAGLHARSGEADRARREHAHALELARAIGEGALECAALNGLGTVDFEQGRMEQAQVHYEAALAAAQRIGDRQWQGVLQGNLGNLHAHLGRMDLARQGSEGALQAARSNGDRLREGNALCNLGMMLYLLGRHEESQATSVTALRTARELGFRRLECSALGNLGLALAALGQTAAAVSHYEDALAVARSTGNTRLEGLFFGYLGLAQARMRQFDGARASFAAGKALLEAASDDLSLALLHCNRAECEWLAGEPTAAADALDAARRLARRDDPAEQSELGQALRRVAALLSTRPG